MLLLMHSDLLSSSGNACILRGGSDSINSNIAIADVIANALSDNGINPDVINLIKDTDRALVNQLMKMNDYIDVIIPRGGAGLIKNVVNNSTVPVIETGTGNCHVYVDEYADIDMAVKVIYNAKTSRIEYVMRVNHWLFTKLLQKSRQFHLL